MRSHRDIEEAMESYGGAVWRICILYFSSSPDAQDAYQETFLKYALSDGVAFRDEEHKKAWLLRVCSNLCKDMLRKAERRTVSLEDAPGALDLPSGEEAVEAGPFSNEVVEAFRSLSDPPRTPLFLALCEGYTASEISDILDAPVNTVYSWISRGKKQLREVLS